MNRRIVTQQNQISRRVNELYFDVDYCNSVSNDVSAVQI